MSSGSGEAFATAAVTAAQVAIVVIVSMPSVSGEALQP
jgi:hypothetical protein